MKAKRQIPREESARFEGLVVEMLEVLPAGNTWAIARLAGMQDVQDRRQRSVETGGKEKISLF